MLSSIHGEGRPRGVSVDSIEGFYNLKLLLLHHRIEVHYFRTRMPGEKDYSFTPSCNICENLVCSDGTPLLRCSQCALVHYCCREHQKKDWKKHKAFCENFDQYVDNMQKPF